MPQSETPVGATAADRLESWKEIAVYLNRDVRTVQRWEKSEGLPVHRHVHEKLGTVYGYRSEIETWRNSRALPDAHDGDIDESAEVAVLDTEPAPLSAPAVHEEGPPAGLGRTTTPLLVASIITIAILLAWMGWQKWKPKPHGNLPASTIVVLPFDNLSGDPAQEYFSDGMTEELIVQLGRLQTGRLQTIAAGSSMGFKNTRKSIAEIARELHAGYVVEGSVRRSGDRVRIAAHLIRAGDDAHLWDESYDRDLRDVLTLQTEVAASIVRGISANLVTRPAAARAVNPEAYETYLKGRFHLNKRTPDDLEQAIALFRQATNADPTYAPAFVGLADCYALLGSAEMGSLPPREAMPLARQAVLKALRLDPDLAEAHASLGHIKLIYDWDLPGAKSEFERAIELNPAHPTAHQWYALYFNAVGRTPEAVAEINRARELDPLSPTIHIALSEAYYFARDYEQSMAESRKALELDPNFVLGLLTLGRSLVQVGRVDEAIVSLQKGWEITRGPAMTTLLAYAYAVKGDRARSRALLDQLQAMPHRRPPVYVPALYPAGLYAALDDKDTAFKYLAQALEERCEYLVYLHRDPMADNVRSDPRFEQVLQSTGLRPPVSQPRWTQ